MLTKEDVRNNHDHRTTPEFHEPEAWLGLAPHKPVKICFSATNLEAWEAGTEAVINWRGKRFRIVCEGNDASLTQTSRGILVGE